MVSKLDEKSYSTSFLQYFFTVTDFWSLFLPNSILLISDLFLGLNLTDFWVSILLIRDFWAQILLIKDFWAQILLIKDFRGTPLRPSCILVYI